MEMDEGRYHPQESMLDAVCISLDTIDQRTKELLADMDSCIYTLAYTRDLLSDRFYDNGRVYLENTKRLSEADETISALSEYRMRFVDTIPGWQKSIDNLNRAFLYFYAKKVKHVGLLIPDSIIESDWPSQLYIAEGKMVEIVAELDLNVKRCENPHIAKRTKKKLEDKCNELNKHIRSLLNLIPHQREEERPFMAHCLLKARGQLQ
jgi:hypothetical protein